MKEKDVRDRLSELAEAERHPDWLDDPNLCTRYGGVFPREKTEVHPKVEVEIIDATEEVTKLIRPKKGQG